VTATGTPRAAYLWYRDGEALPGETGAVLAFAAVRHADAGTYRVLVTDSNGSLWSAAAALGNERTHYTLPGTGPDASDDVLLYRSKEDVLYASMRSAPGVAAWSAPAKTDIPNDNSNINAGALPDGAAAARLARDAAAAGDLVAIGVAARALGGLE
jgi:predicted neuraminidase